MSIPPFAVKAARLGWNCQWKILMNGLGPSDEQGNYKRPKSQHQTKVIPSQQDILSRSPDNQYQLIIGRSCPWAHRTLLVHKLRKLNESINIIFAEADHKKGRWKINPTWKGCDSLISIYKLCGAKSNQRATVPVLVDPGNNNDKNPEIIGNESSILVEVLNKWPSSENNLDLAPKELENEITNWNYLLQDSLNNGVYKCGFARNQIAYEKASHDLFEALEIVEKSLKKNGPWLCGKKLTLADIRLFPTLVRWEMVYLPLFNCSKEPLWSFTNVWKWRQKFMALPSVSQTCKPDAWREDYFGALFPLRPSNIVPEGPELKKIINSNFTDIQ